LLNQNSLQGRKSPLTTFTEA